MKTRWSIVLLLVASCGTASADTLATVTASGNEIKLLTERCGAGDRRMQRAERQEAGTRLQGCWSVNTRSNPVILWSDGSVQEIAASRVRLAEKYAAMLEDEPVSPEQRNTVRADFPRATWCPRARFPHERLVCQDPALAAADLALATLWRAYRGDLTAVQRAQAKRDYFRRLEACGANKSCIQREQATQGRVYREALEER